MDGVQSENTKITNQAWRRRPRKFASKSRLGLKCDLSQLSCLKCRSTGRTCDGYGEMSPTSKIKAESGYHHNGNSNRKEACNSYHPYSMTSAYQSNQWHAEHHDLIPQNLGPFIILPVTEPYEIEAMSFFELMSIKHLNEYYPSESWRNTLMFFSQTVPSVQSAATALALIYRDYLNNDCTAHGHQLPSSTDQSLGKAPLLHYNRAIRLLLSQETCDSTERTVITLMVCHLFTCSDNLAGNYVQATEHLRGGVELSCSIGMASFNSNSTHDDIRPSGIRAPIAQVSRQIRRLDMQAVTFLVDWVPADLQDTLVSQIPPSDGAFQSLDQAADHLQILAVRVMGLRNTEQRTTPMDQIMPKPALEKDVVYGQLETWSGLFENMLQRDSSYQPDFTRYPLVSLLRLRHTHHRVGILPVLYIIGAKCRHPLVRREALGILRRQPMREAVRDSIVAAKVVERIIEVEEGGLGDGETAQSMERIAVRQGIGAVSWVQVRQQSVARVDIKVHVLRNRAFIN
ncbi:hypothetical protein LZ31DRAFT_564021 [Colletotrichum somersetense]|nr:hypothetical protein LZ31DRAFT_564021 [Colletotrichum somersetense]